MLVAVPARLAAGGGRLGCGGAAVQRGRRTAVAWSPERGAGLSVCELAGEGARSGWQKLAAVTWPRLLSVVAARRGYLTAPPTASRRRVDMAALGRDSPRPQYHQPFTRWRLARLDA